MLEASAKSILESGAAFDTFEKMVVAQGGDLSVSCLTMSETVAVKADRPSDP